MGGSHTVLGWSCGDAMTHVEFSAALLCRCHPVHFLPIVLVTTNRTHISGSVQFGESADERSPNFVKGVNCCPCLWFSALDVILRVYVGSEIFKILYFLNLIPI